MQNSQFFTVRTCMYLRLGAIFGILSFVQGISEPTTGLAALPDQQLLKQWGESPGQIAAFVATLTLPWCIRPVFGLVTDFVPLFGLRRKSYLLAATFIGAVAMALVAFQPLEENYRERFLVLLVLASSATAFCDVVIDALMIEIGRPFAIVGRLQFTGQLKDRIVWLVAAFVFLWSFNPLSSAVIYFHFTTALSINETHYGDLDSLSAVGAVSSCLAYGCYGGRLSARAMIALAVLGSIFSSGVYLCAVDLRSASVISFLTGVSYMAGNMAVIDLAARACPTNLAGTVFAAFMSLTNLSTAMSMCIGGYFYQYLCHIRGPSTAFAILILLGMVIGASCWLIPLQTSKIFAQPIQMGEFSAYSQGQS